VGQRSPGGGRLCGASPRLTLDGSPLRYQPDADLPDVLICRPELADRVMQVTISQIFLGAM
jgi:hypothetical protein